MIKSEHNEHINTNIDINDIEEQNRLALLFFKWLNEELGDLCEKAFKELSITDRWAKLQDIRRSISYHPEIVQKIIESLRKITTGTFGICFLDGFLLFTGISSGVLSHV